MKPEKIAQYTALAGIGWLSFIIILYYVSHKPFDSQSALQFAKTFWQILSAVVIIAVSGGIGRSITGPLSLPPLARLAVNVLFGSGIAGTGILIIGSFVPLLKPILFILFFILPILFFRFIRIWLVDLIDIVNVWKESDKSGRMIALILVLLVGLAFILSLAPPIEFDALVYHLTLPVQYLNNNQISHIEIIFSGMPQLVEMLYTWAIAVGGLQAGPIFGMAVSVICLLGLLGTIRHRVNTQAAWAALACLLAGFTLASSLSWGYVDWFVLAFGWANLTCLDQWQQKRETHYLVLAGVFCAFALSTKYTGGVLLLVNLGYLLWDGIRHRQEWLKNCLIIGTLTTIISLPWWIKNWIYTGNPFFPFIFPSREPGMDAGIRIYQNAPAWGNWQDILLLPIRATYMGIEGAAGYGASIGPLLLGLGIFCWLNKHKRQPDANRLYEISLLFSCIGGLIWIIGNQLSGFLLQTRLYFSLFPAFTILAALGYDSLRQLGLKTIRISFLLNAMILFVLCLNTIELGRTVIRSQAMMYLTGSISNGEYLFLNLGDYSRAMDILAGLPPQSKTLMLFEPRGLYCATECLPDDHLDRWKQVVHSKESFENITEKWRNNGYTHLLYGKFGADFMRSSKDPHYTPQDWELLDHFLANLTISQSTDNDYYILYSIP